MKPNKERIQLWVDALRSGKFKQLKGKLSNGRKHMCCLGVACEVSGLGGWRSAPLGGWFGEPLADHVVYYLREKEYRGLLDLDYALLPREVAEWFGLSDRNPTLIVENRPEWDTPTAGELNDNLGYTFEQIADAIKRTYLS